MSVNSSVLSNDSLIFSPIDFPNYLWLNCLLSHSSFLVFAIYTVISVLLLLPLCILVLNYGLQRWLQQCSSATSAIATHSDSFTYHTVIMKLINIFGTIIGSCGIYMNNFLMVTLWYDFFFFTWYGETFFHVLTCVEHYLAVVHPIMYLSLRKERGAMMRNISIGCIWLLCLCGTNLVTLEQYSLIVELFLLIFSIITIFLCSLFVLCVLIRPGPGEQGRDREKADQPKQRAFITIVTILGVLFLRCVWNLLWVLHSLSEEDINHCVWIIGAIWINLPSSLVLPLLFLHRAGILMGCRNNMK